MPANVTNLKEQITMPGKIKDTTVGSEMITFMIPLERVKPGTKKLVCIVNIPPEGRRSAPVYIKPTND